MLKMTGTVVVDGVEQSFTAGPAAMSLWEQYASRNNLSFDNAPMTGSLYVAYAAVHKDNWPPQEGFDKWRFRVDDLDLDEQAEVAPLAEG